MNDDYEDYTIYYPNDCGFCQQLIPHCVCGIPELELYFGITTSIHFYIFLVFSKYHQQHKELS